MNDPRIRVLAKSIVEYSITVKKGDKVCIHPSGFSSDPIVRELITEILRAGGVPFTLMRHPAHSRRFLLGANEEQMKVLTDVYTPFMEAMDCYISISAGENSFETSDVPSEKMKLYGKTYVKKIHHEILIPNTRWVVLNWPNGSYAQKAQMSTEAFEDFYFRVCTVDYEKMSLAMDSLVACMSETDRVRITAPGTDISFSIKDIPVIKCAGTMNIPDGEVFTAPVKNSANGTILYNAPSVHEGIRYDKVCLTYEDGRLVKASAANDNERLAKVFEIDDGANYLGEFAIGVNPFILKPMMDTLFDEKIAGSIHLTPGASYDEAPNGNKSTLHWDLVLIQRPEYGGGEVYFDDVLVRKNGLFVTEDLLCLNPENLK